MKMLSSKLRRRIAEIPIRHTVVYRKDRRTQCGLNCTHVSFEPVASATEKERTMKNTTPSPYRISRRDCVDDLGLDNALRRSSVKQ